MGIIKTTNKTYTNYLYSYGIVSLLFVCQYFEKIENYEECQKIINAINEHNNIMKTDKLSTVITKELIDDVINTYKDFKLTGDNLIDNSQYYAELMILEIHSTLC